MRMRRKVILTLLLLSSSVLVFFYYAFVHSGLPADSRITALNVHGYHAPQDADSVAWHDESLESVRRQLDQLEHQDRVKGLAKEVRALAKVPVPTPRQPRIVHRFGDGSSVSVTPDDSKPRPRAPRTLEMAEEAYATAAGAGGVTASCEPFQRFGPAGDGGWTVCLAGPYRPQQGGCLSVSFGVGTVWSYDDQIAERFGCRTLAFDPSLNGTANHTRLGSGVQFFRLGLHARRGNLPGTGWPVDSLQGLLDSLAGGPGVIVDLLKLDIEGSEWPALEAALDSGTLQGRVRQLMLELHSREARPWPNEDTEVEDYVRYLDILRRLRDSGFRAWRSEPNDVGGWFYSRAGYRKRRLCCYNVYYINTRFLPSVNASQALMEQRLLDDMHAVKLRLPLRLPSLGSAPELAEGLYFELMSGVHADCPDWRRVGPERDSGYDVCLSEPYALQSAVARRDCLVYSFGVGEQYGFEDELAGVGFGCQVRMFDPSLTHLGEHKRGRRQWVHLVGLGASDGERGGTGWRMSRLRTLLHRFGHEAAVIDLVKVDIELDEWDALDAAVADGALSRVKQLIVETHTKELRDGTTRPADYLRFAGIWLRLYRAGFRQWRSRENVRTHFLSPTGHNRPCCHEHSLVNINFLL